MNSKKKIEIEIFEEHDKVTFYTLRYVDEDLSETEVFFQGIIDSRKFDEDLEIISKMIDKIGENGAKQNNFRKAGTPKDGVGAIPEYLYSSKLRLYAIRLNENIVILGNGGLKTTKTYNEDPHLDGCVELLIKVDKLLKHKIRTNQVSLYNKQLYGNLIFRI